MGRESKRGLQAPGPTGTTRSERKTANAENETSQAAENSAQEQSPFPSNVFDVCLGPLGT